MNIEELSIQNGAVDLKKPNVQHEKKLDTQLEMLSDIARKIRQESGQINLT